MGVETQRQPPLPAPTEPSTLSLADRSHTPTDFGTEVSRRTDRTSYSIPEDGSPITISTAKHERGLLRGQKSQTSLLIEYFEAGKSGDKVNSRPSVRVKVTPSSKSRKAQLAHDHIQVTEVGKDRKPSYTRRISLGSKHQESRPLEGTDVSAASEHSSLTGRLPIEIEVVQNESDLSGSNPSRDRSIPLPSDVSSMPPDSMLESAVIRTPQRRRSRSPEREKNGEMGQGDLLRSPPQQARSKSHERITQRVMEKLKDEKLREKSRDAGSSHKRRSSRESGYSKERTMDSPSSRRRRSSKSHREEEHASGAESSVLTSQLSPSYNSSKSGISKSSMNNPKLLETVEDAIRRLILPELTALKAEQKAQQFHEKSERDVRDSITSGTSYSDETVSRRLSKSSSAPNVSSKPKVVLNRVGEDRGVVLSHGDSVKTRKVRRSSRDSPSEKSHSRRESLKEEYRDERSARRKSSKESPRAMDKAAAAVAGGVLTAAALRHHDSQPTVRRSERETESSRDRSRTESMTESRGDTPFATPFQEGIPQTPFGEAIPPMPLQSEVQSSELTRESILSAETERPHARSSRGSKTPVQEVSRGSVGHRGSSTSSTPNRTPTALRTGLGTHQDNRSLGDSPIQRPHSERSITSKAREAALAAAGLGGTALLASHSTHRKYRDVDKFEQDYEQRTPLQELSPVQSEGSLKGKFSEGALQPVKSSRSATSITAGSHQHPKRRSDVSADSLPPSPAARTFESKDRPQAISLESRRQVLGSDRALDAFFEEEHLKNDHLRESYMSEESQRDSSFIEYRDSKHMSNYTDDSVDPSYLTTPNSHQKINNVSANAQIIRTPVVVESVVASLLGPSSMSGLSRESRQYSVADASYDSIPDRLRFTRKPVSASDSEKDTQGSQDESSVKQHWSAIKERAKNLSEQSLAKNVSQQSLPKGAMGHSPNQSLTDSAKSKEEIVMVASGLPDMNDPLPEIGHYNYEGSEEIVDSPQIHGNASHGKQYEYDDVSPPQSRGSLGPSQGGQGIASGFGARSAGALGVGALAGAHLAESRHAHGEISSKDREVNIPGSYPTGLSPGHTPLQVAGVAPTSPGHWKDEGYMSRTPGGFSPESFRHERYSANDGAGDVFASGRHLRHMSANSHGMGEPLYDSATGKGIDGIQSKDVVALMDHLTVRDAQRNARDTEILVTLVRSAAEMRNSFEEMKRFIAEQDQVIMEHTDQDTDRAVQKILAGPRPQPTSGRRGIRHSAAEDDEDLPTKKANVFKRALRGLSGRSSNDLANIEAMLVQLLDEVQGLKHGEGVQRPQYPATNSLNSSENLRTVPDPGYEPEGRAGTSSTPDQSGSFSNPSSRQVNGMRSAQTGAPGSGKRVSTVMEGDEELDDHEGELLDQQYGNEERLLTPTQEAHRDTFVPHDTSPQRLAQTMSGDNVQTPRAAEKHRKHKSNNSSIFDRIPRISRWSKTTTSSVPDNRNSMQYLGNGRERPDSSDSHDAEQAYELNEDDRLRSTNSLANSALAREQPRSASPLIPEHQMRDLMNTHNADEEAKYQAHRNSLNLQHPQPRQASMYGDQSQWERQALEFDPTDSHSSPDVEMWGSSPSLARMPALNQNRFGGFAAPGGGMPMSPISSEGGLSERSARVKDEGPLVPHNQTQGRQQAQSQDTDFNQSYASPRFEYNSPYGSGHQLAPIAEVRRSLESDSGYARELLLQQEAAKGTPAGGLAPMLSPQRKITGPRPMGPKSPTGYTVDENRQPSYGSEKEIWGTVRRKPVRGAGGEW